MKIIPSQIVRYVLSVVCALAIAPCISQHLQAQSVGFGNIRGSVNNVDSSRGLEGAIVEIRALNRSVKTDSAGTYVLDGIPVGEHTLTASYMGLLDESFTVTVVAGQTSYRDFALKEERVYMLDSFSVRGAREGDAAAQVAQKNADSFVEVLALDSFGILSNGNTGELLSRLPGVAVEVDDNGDVMGVMIRGIDKKYNLTTLDGGKLASAAGLGRDFRTQNISAAMFSKLEVFKTVTPDMDHDGLGGIVNYVTQRPLSYGKRQIRYNFGLRFNAPFLERTPMAGEHPLHAMLSFSYTDVFRVGASKKANLGVSVAGFYSENANGNTNLRYYYTRFDNPDEAMLRLWETFDQYNNRKQMSGTLRMEWQASKTMRIHAGVIYNDSLETSTKNYHTNMTFITNQSMDKASATWIVNPSISRMESTGSASNASFTIQSRAYSFHDRQRQWSIGAEHDFGRIKFNYDFNQSYSHVVMDDKRPDSGVTGGNFSMGVKSVRATLDRSASDWDPSFTYSGPRPLNQLSTYYNENRAGAEMTMTMRNFKRYQDITNFGGNVEIKRPFNIPFTLKAGGKFRRFTAGTRAANETYTFNKSRGSIADIEALLKQDFHTDRWDQGDLPWIDPGLANQALKQSLRDGDGKWTLNQTALYNNQMQNNKHVREDIISGYLMGTKKIKRLTILAGVRYEYTDIEARGYISVKNQFTPKENTASYGHYYPGVHLTYRFTDNLAARFDWSTTVGRAALDTYAPSYSISSANQRVTINNPDIQPERSMNFDFNLSYYFTPKGSFSFGVFRKNLDKFLYQHGFGTVAENPHLNIDDPDGTLQNFEVWMQGNGGRAHIQGFELAYDQRMEFLPGILKGIRLMANYTRLWTKGNYGETEDELPLFVPETANIELSFTYKRFTGAIAWRHQGKEMKNYYTFEGSDIFMASRRTVNVNLKYRLMRDMELYASMSNIFKSETYQYIMDRSRTCRLNKPSQMVMFGIRGAF